MNRKPFQPARYDATHADRTSGRDAAKPACAPFAGEPRAFARRMGLRLGRLALVAGIRRQGTTGAGGS